LTGTAARFVPHEVHRIPQTKRANPVSREMRNGFSDVSEEGDLLADAGRMGVTAGRIRDGLATAWRDTVRADGGPAEVARVTPRPCGLRYSLSFRRRTTTKLSDDLDL
jgi:hypothetical protein